MARLTNAAVALCQRLKQQQQMQHNFQASWSGSLTKIRMLMPVHCWNSVLNPDRNREPRYLRKGLLEHVRPQLRDGMRQLVGWRSAMAELHNEQTCGPMSHTC